jgi:spore coat protein CotF
MTLQLSQKEQQLLKDQQNHEKICIGKYQQYSSQAQDPQLKQLFQSFADKETQHLNTINSMLSGQVPLMQQSQQNQQSQQTTSQTSASPSASKADAMLCNDMLMTEKFVSSAYDTAIFEFADANVRQALNHIQKEEQEHGEGLFNYMNANGMYNTK